LTLKKSDLNQPHKPKPLSGGVRHDARGNAVWQWATETARHAVASTSQLLRRLDVSSLSLEDTEASKTKAAKPPPGKSVPGKPAPPFAGVKPPAPGRGERTGFDPYDAAASARAAAVRGKPAQPRPAAPAAARASWWRRLLQRR
jgi:hypothetical protein